MTNFSGLLWCFFSLILSWYFGDGGSMIVRKWIRTNLRPSVASVGLSFLGITLWNIPPHDLSGHGTEEHVAGRAEEHDVDYNGLCQGWFGWWHSPNINFIYKARHCAAVRRSENSVPLPVQHSIFLAANVSLNFRLKCQWQWYSLICTSEYLHTFHTVKLCLWSASEKYDRSAILSYHVT